jgi:hypothetical protein
VVVYSHLADVCLYLITEKSPIIITGNKAVSSKDRTSTLDDGQLHRNMLWKIFLKDVK